MESPSQSRTSATLLQRLRQQPDDAQAWKVFVHRYGPRIYHWCRQQKLQEADAEDVTQEVLTKLAVKLRTFEYDPTGSFRGWLKTLTHHAWHDFLQSRRRVGWGTGDGQALAQLETVCARDDLVQRLQEEFDQELLDEAIARVRLRVAPQSWEAFRLTAVEGLSGQEAAARVGMKVASLFAAKSKVQRMVREEIQRLEASTSQAGDDKVTR